MLEKKNCIFARSSSTRGRRGPPSSLFDTSELLVPAPEAAVLADTYLSDGSSKKATYSTLKYFFYFFDRTTVLGLVISAWLGKDN